MRGTSGQSGAHGSQRLRLEQRVQLSRGQWRREEAGGAIRSTGWWEAVTVTRSPAATPERPPPLRHRALAAAVDTIAPAVAELVAAAARRLLDRQRGPRVMVASSVRRLPAAARALPRSDQGS